MLYRVSVFLLTLLFWTAGCGLTGSNTADPNTNKPTLKVSESEGNPDSAIIPVEAKTISEQYKILSFTVTADDGSVTLRDVMVSITASVAVSEVVHSAQLVIGGSEFDLEQGLTDSRTETMLRFPLTEKGEKRVAPSEPKTVKLFVRFNPSANFPNDATIQASFGSAALHKSIITETRTGNKLGDDRKSGVAGGNMHTLRESGVFVRNVSTSAMTDTDAATFKAKLEVVAFDTDVYIRKQTNRWTETASNRAHNGFAYFVRNQDGDTVTNGHADAQLSSTGLLRSSPSAEAYRISEGESETVTLTVEFAVDHNTPTEYYRVQPDAFQFATSQANVDEGAWKSHALADSLHTQAVQLP